LRKAYGQEQEAEGIVKGPIFSNQRSETASNSMRHVKGADEALFRKIWAWTEEET
jgi:hypothetical protein